MAHGHRRAAAARPPVAAIVVAVMVRAAMRTRPPVDAEAPATAAHVVDGLPGPMSHGRRRREVEEGPHAWRDVPPQIQPFPVTGGLSIGVPASSTTTPGAIAPVDLYPDRPAQV